MASVPGWHASTRRGEPTSSVSDTGEIRVPLALYMVDQPQGDVPLVLSRADAEELHATLCTHLGLADGMVDKR
ncbi:hypothetical protein [Streptomyces sp. NRRL S-1813]|uniref:hypothetical protein n=1 Tax=Streptomyces sp. NRRL S-1813 TaxID=1463888 RepID=UPI0004C524E1|nr:hypothetical protein [Streptomyces sp. NRRL S-1813]